jgi:hypothetical protein
MCPDTPPAAGCRTFFGNPSLRLSPRKRGEREDCEESRPAPPAAAPVKFRSTNADACGSVLIEPKPCSGS